MSAICGILRFDHGPVVKREIDRILDTMPHRMPDGRRSWCRGSIGLGHGLLCVTIEDRLESQPLHDPETEAVLVADVRFDNRQELAAALNIDAARLAKMPDSALLMAAWRRWGTDCGRYLLGDFFFAIWDGRNQRLVLGRDQMGQRHVLYHIGPDFFIFAPEIKGLWSHPAVPRVLSDASIGRMLLVQELASRPRQGRTLYDGILGLTGATIMVVSADGSIKQETYWQPEADPAHLNRSEDYYVQAYRAILGEAVACRLRRLTHPPGLSFSGGYDSAAIAGLAAPIMASLDRKLVAVASTMPADYTGTIRHARRWVEMCARDMPHLDVHHVTREGCDPLKAFERAGPGNLDRTIGGFSA
jgi:asparagine synthase (glutamine-hydrolysing)